MANPGGELGATFPATMTSSPMMAPMAGMEGTTMHTGHMAPMAGMDGMTMHTGHMASYG